MALPKIETPTYLTKIPSTGDQVEFRPFLVKEEKILLLSQESKSTIEITRAMKKIVKACLFDKVDVDKFTTFDLEYVFLQLRAKSVGETVDLKWPCSNEECGHMNDLVVNLDDVELVYPEKEVSKTVKVNEKVGFTLKNLTLKDLENPVLSKGNETFVESLALMIETIYDENDVYETKDSKPSEVVEFLESLPHASLIAIKDFANAVPKLRYTTTFKCIKCGEITTVEIEGLENFFI